jgi:hypothetical protein
MENSLVVLHLQFPALNSVAVGNQILENVLLAFKMSGNCHFQIKWKIPFDQMSLLLCSHYFPHPTIFLYSGLSNHLI